MRDLHSGLIAVLAIAPAVHAAAPTPVDIDLQGYNSAEIILPIGVGGITFTDVNKIEFKLAHSDDDVTYTDVTDADMLGVSGISNGIIKSLMAAHATADVYRFGYKGNKRYLRLIADFSGTHVAGTPFSAVVLKSHGHDSPQVNQA